MKKTIKTMLALLAALVCGGAWAALDSVWNGDFITLDESGNQVQHLTKTIGSITYTLALNGNKLVYDEATGKSYIEITNTNNGQLGATVTRSIGTGNSNGGSVLFKYSNLKTTEHEPNSIICTLWEESKTEAGYQNITGLQLKSADATNATLSGFWAEGSVNNNGNSENNTSGTIPLASGTVAISYGGTGANVFLKNEATGYWTKVYKSEAYGQNTYSIKGVAFGGFYGAITRTDKTDFTNAAVPQKGLRIHAVAVYDQAPRSGSDFDFEFVEPKTWPADEILVDHCIDMDAWMTTNVTVPDGSESTILTTLRDNYNISGALGGNWVNSETPLAAAARFPTIQDDGILTVELQATDGSNTKAVLVGVKVDGGVLKVKALKAALRGVANSSEKQFNYTSESNITAVYSAGTLKDTYGGGGYAAVRIYFEKKAAAKIDGKYYATLEDAFAAATEGQTVTLLENVTGDLTVPANRNVNAAAYTISGEIIIGSGAKVLVAGNRTTNGISGEGTFVVSGGTITANNKANGYAVDGTTIKIDGGTFKLNNAVSGGYTGGNTSDKKDSTINNAKFIIAEAGTLTNFGWVNMLGTIEFDYSCDAEETIMGGSNPSFRGTPNIIKSGTGAIYFDVGVATNAKFTSLTLNGGTLRTKAAVTVDELISGVTGKVVRYDSSTKTYSLVDAVASIGDREFTSLYEALTTAASEATEAVSVTVTLLTNCGDAFAIPENVIVDTASHTVSGAITGSGTIKFSSNPTGANLTANQFTADAWTGTVELPALNAPGQVKLQDMGNTGSKIILNGITGNAWLEEASVTVDAELILKGNVGFNNGSSNKMYTFNKVSCEGDHTMTLGSWTGCTAITYVINTLNKFAGTINLDNVCNKSPFKVNFSVGNIVTDKTLAAGTELVKVTKTGTNDERIALIGINLESTTVNSAAETLEWKNDAICLCARNVYINSNSPTYQLTSGTDATLRTGDVIVFDNDIYPNNGARWADAPLFTNFIGHKTIVGISMNIRGGLAANQAIEVNAECYFYGGMANGATVSGTGTLYVGYDQIALGNVSVSCGTFGFQPNGTTYTANINGAVTLGSTTTVSEGAAASAFVLNTDTATLTVPTQLTDGKVKCGVNGMTLRKRQNDSGMWVYYLVTTPAASVGDQDFADLAEAITYAQTAHLPVVLGKNVEGALNIPGGVTIDSNGLAISGAITGSGTIIFSSKTTLEANLTANAFTADAWMGTVWLKNIGTADINNNDSLVTTGTLAKLGHSGTIVKMTGCRGFIYENDGVNFAWTLELEGDETFDYGWSNRSGWGGRKHRIAALKGTGTYEARSRHASTGNNCYEVAYFTMAEDFRGSIDLGKNAAANTADSKGKIVVIGTYEGATFNPDSNGQLYIGSDASLTIASGKQIHAVKTNVKGTLGGAGRIDCNLNLVDGATIDVTDGAALTLADGATITFPTHLNILGTTEEVVIFKNIAEEPEGLMAIEVEAKETAESDPIPGSLAYDAVTQTIKFSKVTFRRWTINSAAVTDGAVDWEADDAWLEGSTPCTWGGDMSDVIAEIDASVVQSIKIASTISPMRVVVTGGSDSTFVFNTAYVGSEGNYSVPVDYVITSPINVSGFSGTLGLRAQIDGEITFGSATQLKFVSPTAGQRTTAYDYKLVNVSNPIQIEGPGSFRVPTTMYNNVPFKILAGGIAEFEVLEGTQVLSGQLTGAGAVKKTGAGTLEITHANTFSGGTTIDAGTIRLANTGTDDYSLGNAGSAVTVNAGGTLDVNGQQGYGLHVTLNGGKIVNNGGNREYARQIDQLTLTANSTVGGTGKFGVLAYGAGKNNLTLNGFTLTKVDGNEFSFCNSAISAGKIRVEGGAVRAYRTGSSMTQVDFEVAAGGTLNSATAMSLKNLTVEENGTILPTNTITVNGTLTLAKAIKVIGAVDTVAMVKAGYEGELPLVTLLNANGTEVAGLYKLVKDGNNLKVAQITENTTFPINTAESAPQVIIDTAFIAETVDNVASKTGDEISEALSATTEAKPLSIAEAYVLGLTAEQAKSGQLVIKGAQTTSPNTMRIYVDGNPQVRPDTGVKVAYKVLVSSTPDGEEGDEIELGTESSAEVELPTEENEKVRYYKIKANITGSSQTVSSVSSASLASAAAGNLFAPTTVNGDVAVFAMTATSAIAEGTPLDLELGGTAFAEGQRFDLVVTPAASRAVTSATLAADRTLHFETPAIENGSTISVVAVNPSGLGTIKVDSYTFDGILMTCKDSTEKPLVKMLGNAPIADGAHNWDATGKVDRTTEDTSANSGALYRIVAVAKGNGMVTTMFDARSNWKDLGQATVWNDWAGADSFDNGNSWTAARLMIDVPNWGDNVTPNTTGLDASVRKNCDLIDPCLGYDANRQKFVVMGLTGGGLISAGAGGVNSDLVIYERDAEKGSEWTGRTSIETEILSAITAAMNDGTDYSACIGILEGPGHAYTTTTDLVSGGVTIPAGTPIFALQYFGSAVNYTSRTCAAWYTVDSNGVKTWHVTKLTDQGSQEPSLTVLDDGSLYMIGKGGGQRKAYRSKDYINWVAVDNVTADQSVQGTILKIGSKDGTGVYAHATPTSGRAQIKVFIGTDNSASAGTAPIRWNTSTPAANVWPDSCWSGGYTTMFMIDEHTLGVIFEVQSHVYLNAVDVSAYVD